MLVGVKMLDVYSALKRRTPENLQLAIQLDVEGFGFWSSRRTILKEKGASLPESRIELLMILDFELDLSLYVV